MTQPGSKTHPGLKRAELIAELSVEPSTTLAEAFRRMDRLDRKLLIVAEFGRVVSVLSAGDIQRHLVRNNDFNAPVQSAIRANAQLATVDDDRDQVRRTMIRLRTEFMPIVDSERNLVDLIFWDDLLENDALGPAGTIDIPVVVMAGGVGSRLKPLTNVIPKALVPIGERPIVEVILDSFAAEGASRFFLSVNYKADMIKQFFNQLETPFDIEYLTETEPLGTAGSLALLKDKISTSFFVSNCDVVVDQDYSEVLAFHLENSFAITIIAAVQCVSIPYGTLDVATGGLLNHVTEKPVLNFLVNTGMYVLEPSVLDHVSGRLDFPDLIEKMKADGHRIGVFPVSEGAWLDIGEWPQYQRTQELFAARRRWSSP